MIALRAQADAGVSQRLREADLEPIAALAEQEIHAGRIPGAVILIGNEGKIVYRRAFGHRALRPEKLPMTADTIFDLASLTKVVATTTAVMQLVEEGKLRLEDPVARYWPEFTVNGKTDISVRALLTHYSGLRPDLDTSVGWRGYDTALKLIVAEKPRFAAETRFLYSDINFAILGELIRRISGLPLDVYCARHIFIPLGMTDTGFNPAPAQHDRIAPTVYRHREMQFGVVHDPTAYRMGGVAGHAGLFSTADDLARFAQMLLDGGSANGVRILRATTVAEMTRPQSPPRQMRLRGLGWDLDTSSATDHQELWHGDVYGHTGFTGTSLWVDPASRTYVIILTNRVHPDGKGDVQPLRKRVAQVVATALGSPAVESETVLTREGVRGKVESGIDVLAAEQFAPLAGLRVGLITNHTGLDAAGRRTLELLHRAPNVKLAAIFSPEHGLYGNVDEKVASGVEPITALPVYSLYGSARRPTAEMIAGLDALVFDIQDVGVRFYTYITTMAYAMEAAAKKGVAF
ncbi:MAG: serine hydrolase, partial [Verrucomicrobiota bacterium]